MTTKEQAKNSIKQIIEDFSRTSEKELNSKSEEQIKFQFIEPLLSALGWQRNDIEKEERVLKGRADYILRIGNQEALVIEAKRTGVNLNDDDGRQAVSYAYHRKIKFAILTNFREFRIYHALSNTRNTVRNLMKDDKGYLSLTSDNYLSQFDRLWLASRESLQSGGLQKLLSKKEELASRPIDESILMDLLDVREMLSKDLKKYRMHLAKDQIDEIVQMLIDRLIFMRSVEDRGLESKDFLLKIVEDFDEGRSSKRIWDVLKDRFGDFDKKYNSKLFTEGLLEKEGFFDEYALKKSIHILYYGSQNHDRYRFDDIPGDLLGAIYEQYLGTILSESDKRVKLKEEKGKRKKMGIYYTPAYISNYIVEKTVGEYLKNKDLDEILDVKIIDPACGSGSFLVRAYVEVCKHVENCMRKGEKSKKWIVFKDYSGRLTVGQKKQILKNCIYGVDLDEKAVELAQLNLLLKVLEEENHETKNCILPSMAENIVCGNSLLGIDFYRSPQASGLSKEQISNLNPFDYKTGFKDVAGGKFDVVIGNPPYIRIQTLNDVSPHQVSWLNENYKSAGKGNYDIYVLFLEKGLDILKKDGKLGYILPHKFFNSKYGEPIRGIIGKHLSSVTHFGDQQIFSGATTYTCLIFLNKNETREFEFTKVDNLNQWSVDGTAKSGMVSVESIGNGDWNFSADESTEIVNKLEKSFNKLSDFAERIAQGIRTSANEVYVLDTIKHNGKLIITKSKILDKEIILEKECLMNFLQGREIKPYILLTSGKVVIVPYTFEKNRLTLLSEKEISEKYPNVMSYLIQNKLYLEDRENGRMKGKNWYAYIYPKNIDVMKRPKILFPDIADKASFAYDESGEFAFTSGYGITFYNEMKESPKYILGLLNSKLLDFCLKRRSTTMRGGFFRYFTQYVEKLPIRKINFSKNSDRIAHDNLVSLVDHMIKLQKNSIENNSEKDRLVLSRQINAIGLEIDEIVYNLYGITDEDRKVIKSG